MAQIDNIIITEVSNFFDNFLEILMRQVGNRILRLQVCLYIDA